MHAGTTRGTAIRSIAASHCHACMKYLLYFAVHFFNPLTRKIAGKRFSPYALVRHKGRKSGKVYETPVIVEPWPGGFIFELTYGAKADWYRNIKAANGCELVYKGKTYHLSQPEWVAGEEGVKAFPALLGVVLKLRGSLDFFAMKIESDSSKP